MFEFATLLTIGFLGGCFGRVVWIFLSSIVVLLITPVYLVLQRGIDGVFAVILLSLLAVMTVQLGSVTGLLVLRSRRKAQESSRNMVDGGSPSRQNAFFSMSTAGSGRESPDE